MPKAPRFDPHAGYRGTIRLANPAAAKQFGYAGAELVGQPIALLFGDDNETWKTAWSALMEGPSFALARPVEMVARRKNGLPSHVEMSASRWQVDSRIFVTAILRDVNERRTAEDALHRLNQTLEQKVAERTADRDRMWRLSTDVMLVARRDGAINAVNPAWQTLLGWDEMALQGLPFEEIVVPEDRPKLRAALDVLVRDTVPAFFELRVRTRDGGSRWIAWSAVAEAAFIERWAATSPPSAGRPRRCA